MRICHFTRGASFPTPPPCDCVFDSYRGTVGFDIYPFAITTRVDAANEVYLKVYEEFDDKDSL